MYLRSFDYRRTNFCLSVQIVECGAKSVNGKNKEEVFFYSHLFAPSSRLDFSGSIMTILAHGTPFFGQIP